jgi:TrmH family RNA methyltransferase
MTTDRPATLTSAANPRVRAVLDLRERRGRQRAGRIVVDGAREVARALDAGLEILEAFTDADAGPGASAEEAAVIARLMALGVAVTPVAGAARERLAYGDRAGALLAVATPPATTLDRVAAAVAASPDALVVVVEDAEKPGNLGAIARSADGAGAAALVAAVDRGPAVDPWNPNAIRASLGTILAIPLAVAPTAEVLPWLRAARLRIVAAVVDAPTPYHAADLRGPLAIAVGSEAHGLGEPWAAPDIEGVRIPMHGRADSLNLSAAAAILLFEARRQRGAGDGPALPGTGRDGSP